MEARRQEGTEWINTMWVSSNSNHTEATDEEMRRGELRAGPTVKWGMGKEDSGDEKRKGGKETLTGLTEAETKVWSRRARGGDRKWCKEMKVERAWRKKSYKLWGDWKGWRWMEYSGPEKVIKVLDPETDVWWKRNGTAGWSIGELPAVKWEEPEEEQSEKETLIMHNLCHNGKVITATRLTEAL